MEDPIFIVGLHRTGSTLWHNLIAMYPKICRLTELRMLGPWWQKDFRYFLKSQVGDLSIDKNVQHMVELIFSPKHVTGLDSAFWRFENFAFVKEVDFQKEVCLQIINSDRSINSIARILIESLTNSTAQSRACVKFPVDVSHISELLQWYPSCRVIHISRDPRAIAMSKMNDPSGTAIKIGRYPYFAFFIKKLMMLFVIFQYIQTSYYHKKFKRLKNYDLFLYEDLLTDTERTMKRLCDFLNIEFSPEFLHLEMGIHEHQPSSLTGKRNKSFDPKAAMRWQSLISPFDKWIITLLTKGSMKRLGYDPTSHPIVQNVNA